MQWAVLTPLLLLVVLGGIQTGIVLHGRSVAANAALAGAQAQSLAGAGSGEAQRVAEEVATDGGLRDVRVQVSQDTSVEVDVEARADDFAGLPGLSTIHAHAAAPVEEPR